MKKKTGKILSFGRDAEYFYNKFLDYKEESNSVDALVAIREAVSLAPDNFEYQFCLAEHYAEMGLSELSDYTAFEIMRKTNKYNAKCCYIFALNSLVISDFSTAEALLNKYIDYYDDDTYLEAANNYLDMLADGTFYNEEDDAEEELGIENLSDDDADEYYEIENTLPFINPEAPDDEDSENTIKRLEKIVKKYPFFVRAKNNLSLIYYFLGRNYESLKLNQEVINRKPHDIHARCNNLLICKEINEDLYKRSLLELKKYKPSNIDEAQKLAHTYCSLGLHEQASEALFRILNEMPYDKKTLYMYAASLYNTGKTEQAKELFADFLKVFPDDLIANYYNEKFENEPPKEMSYLYSLPKDETDYIYNYIDSCTKKPISEQIELWKNDKTFISIIKWLISIDSIATKNVAMSILATIDDYEAEKILRIMLFDPDELFYVKEYVKYLLTALGSQSPYGIRNINGFSIEGIDDFRNYPFLKDAPESLIRLFENVNDYLFSIERYDLLYKAEDLLLIYKKHTNSAVVSRVNNTVGGLLYNLYYLSGEEAPIKDICEKYNLSEKTLNNYFIKVREILGYERH